MASLFEAYITNLGKYNEGELVGETLKFPTTTEEVAGGLLKRNRRGRRGCGMRNSSSPALTVMCWGSMTISRNMKNLDELNHLACLLSELDQGDLEKFGGGH